MPCGKCRERMPSASGKCLWAGFSRGTRRHHEADVQLSGFRSSASIAALPHTNDRSRQRDQVTFCKSSAQRTFSESATEDSLTGILLDGCAQIPPAGPRLRNDPCPRLRKTHTPCADELQKQSQQGQAAEGCIRKNRERYRLRVENACGNQF